MLALKILAGPQSGQTIKLKHGKNVIGRGDTADIIIQDKSVSRNHFEIFINDNQITIQDLQSSNGTFLNGVKIKSADLNINDLITVNDLVLQLVPFEITQMATPRPQPVAVGSTDENSLWQTESPQVPPSHTEAPHTPQKSKSLITAAQDYFENVVMPGVYRLGEIAEFKWILGSFVLTFVISVTLLATYPLVQIARERIEQESRLRIYDIATQLARRYQTALQQGLHSSFEVSEDQRQGVVEALVISADDGSVLAPPASFGTSRDLPFIHSARQIENATVDTITSSQLGAAIPIRKLNPNTGDYSVYAYAVVLYDMGSRALRFEDVVRLFVQVLAIALSLGLILFVFMYRLIEYPISKLNSEIDQALRDGNQEAKVDFKYPEFQRLLMNVNSALSRIDHSSSNDLMTSSPVIEAGVEAEGLVQVLNVAAIVVSIDGKILAINQECETLIGNASESLLNHHVTSINDQALVLNISDLINQIESVPGNNAQSELEFGGISYIIEAAPIHGVSAVKYIVITFRDNNLIAEGF